MFIIILIMSILNEAIRLNLPRFNTELYSKSHTINFKI